MTRLGDGGGVDQRAFIRVAGEGARVGPGVDRGRQGGGPCFSVRVGDMDGRVAGQGLDVGGLQDIGLPLEHQRHARAGVAGAGDVGAVHRGGQAQRIGAGHRGALGDGVGAVPILGDGAAENRSREPVEQVDEVGIDRGFGIAQDGDGAGNLGVYRRAQGWLHLDGVAVNHRLTAEQVVGGILVLGDLPGHGGIVGAADGLGNLEDGIFLDLPLLEAAVRIIRRALAAPLGVQHHVFGTGGVAVVAVPQVEAVLRHQVAQVAAAAALVDVVDGDEEAVIHRGVVVDLGGQAGERVAGHVRVSGKVQLEIVEGDQRSAVAVVDIGPELPVKFIADNDGRDLAQLDRVGEGAGLGVEFTDAVGVVALLGAIRLKTDEGVKDPGAGWAIGRVQITNILNDRAVVQRGSSKAGAIGNFHADIAHREHLHGSQQQNDDGRKKRESDSFRSHG